MGSGSTQARTFSFIRRRHKTAQPKRNLQDWIALTIARGLSLAVVGGMLYVTYVIEMAGYNDYLRCNHNTGMTRLEWVLGFRPAEDCGR